MKKWILTLLSCVYIFSTSATTFAHTHLGSTNPADGDTVTEPLTEITLTFEGQIEQGSTFELANTEGTSVELQDISVADGIMTGTLATPLENGEYIVQWNSISADGHPMEGEFAFTVAVPVTEQAVEQTQPAENEAAPLSDEGQEEKEEKSSVTSTMLVIVLALVLIMVASFFFLLRKRK
ncbi:MAG: copper resistance protein CopC [Lysinibacillus sp.]